MIRSQRIDFKTIPMKQGHVHIFSSEIPSPDAQGVHPYIKSLQIKMCVINPTTIGIELNSLQFIINLQLSICDLHMIDVKTPYYAIGGRSAGAVDLRESVDDRELRIIQVQVSYVNKPSCDIQLVRPDVYSFKKQIHQGSGHFIIHAYGQQAGLQCLQVEDEIGFVGISWRQQPGQRHIEIGQTVAFDAMDMEHPLIYSHLVDGKTPVEDVPKPPVIHSEFLCVQQCIISAFRRTDIDALQGQVRYRME